MKIEIVRGTTHQLCLELTDCDTGKEFAMLSTDILRFAMETPLDNVVLRKYVVGKTTITLSPNDTSNLAPGNYYYDIGLERGSDYYQVIQRSPIVILNNVSEKGV